MHILRAKQVLAPVIIKCKDQGTQAAASCPSWLELGGSCGTTWETGLKTDGKPRYRGGVWAVYTGFSGPGEPSELCAGERRKQSSWRGTRWERRVYRQRRVQPGILPTNALVFRLCQPHAP